MYQELIHTFNQYLDLTKVSDNTKKNYSADIRQFLAWLETKKEIPAPAKIDAIFANIDQEIIKEYVVFLKERGTISQQINRKLSSLRKFFSFAISQQWIKINPAKKVKNIIVSKAKKVKSKSAVDELTYSAILESYAQKLNQDKVSNTTVKNYLSDARQFLLWLEKENEEAMAPKTK